MNRDEPFSQPGRGTTPPDNASAWDRAADLFAAALERPAAERRGWLAGLEGIDEALRSEVASLLEASENAGDFLAPGEIRIEGLADLPDPGPDPADPETGDP